jgi:hypothetical protein
MVSAKAIKQLFNSAQNINIKKSLGAANLPMNKFKFDSAGNITGLKNMTGVTSTSNRISSATALAVKNKKMLALTAGTLAAATPGAFEAILGKKDCSQLTGAKLEKCESDNERIDGMADFIRNPVSAVAQTADDARKYILGIVIFIIVMLLITVLF